MERARTSHVPSPQTGSTQVTDRKPLSQSYTFCTSLYVGVCNANGGDTTR